MSKLGAATLRAATSSSSSTEIVADSSVNLDPRVAAPWGGPGSHGGSSWRGSGGGGGLNGLAGFGPSGKGRKGAAGLLWGVLGWVVARPWDAAGHAACGLLVYAGLAVAGLCRSQLVGSTAAHGVFLGYGCALLGMLGWLGTAALPIASSCLPGLSHLDISGSGGLLPVGGEGGGRMGSGRGLRKSGSFGVGRALSRAAGALGLPLRVALLVGLGFCALGTWGLLDAAGNEVAQHCVLAEAAARIAHLEEAVTKLKHDELLTQVFFRLGELDDLVSAVAHSGAAAGELRAQAFHTQLADRDLIRERVGRLQRHAEKLAADMAARLADVKARHSALVANATALKGGDRSVSSFDEYQARVAAAAAEEEARRQLEESAWVLEKRAEAVAAVVQYLEERAHDAHATLSYEEYEIILDALIEGAGSHDADAAAVGSASVPGPVPTDPHAATASAGGAGSGSQGLGVGAMYVSGSPGGSPASAAGAQQQAGAGSQGDQGLASPSVAGLLKESLARDRGNITALKAAFERRRGGAGSGYDAMVMADPRHGATREVAARREAARKEFEARFYASFEGGAGHTRPDIFRASLATALDDLPGHCLRDMGAFGRLRWLSGALLAAQALAAFIGATALATHFRTAATSKYA